MEKPKFKNFSDTKRGTNKNLGMGIGVS